MQWAQQQDTEPGEFVLLLMCVVVCMYVCSAIVKTAETEMPSITKAEWPWQGLWVLIILPTVCNETGKQCDETAHGCKVEVLCSSYRTIYIKYILLHFTHKSLLQNYSYSQVDCLHDVCCSSVCKLQNIEAFLHKLNTKT